MVLPKLTIDLPRPFQMEGMIRKDDTLLHKAVREAVTNMIIHSDLMLNGILIENDPINDPIKLTERQSMILQNFRDDKTLTKESLCIKTGLSDATAKREIAYLKRIGVLKRIGSKKNGYWVVSK